MFYVRVMGLRAEKRNDFHGLCSKFLLPDRFHPRVGGRTRCFLSNGLTCARGLTLRVVAATKPRRKNAPKHFSLVSALFDFGDVNLNYIKYPSDFEDFAWLLPSKGWFEAEAVVNGVTMRVCFYDAYRLQQEKEWATENGEAVPVDNIIVVDVVDRGNMDAAIRAFRR